MRLIIFLLALFSSALVFGQNTHLENRVVEVYGAEYSGQLKNSDPRGFEYLMKVSEHSIYLESNSNPKYASAKLLSEIPLRSKNGGVVSVQDFLNDYNGSNFNALKYDFMPQNSMQIFKLAGTSIILFVNNRSFVMNQNI